MATPEAIGEMACLNPVCKSHATKRTAIARKNSGGFVYYRCEVCTGEFRMHNHRESDLFIKSVVAGAPEPKPAPAPAPKNEPAPPPKTAAGMRTLLG
jgi:YHS domain-containing protein